MAKINTRYSSHLQLQYLMHRMGINQQRLLRDLQRYYNPTDWDLRITPTGKITQAQLKPGHAKPTVNRAKPRITAPKPQVVVRRRRTIGVTR